MDNALVDARAARDRLAAQGWIPRKSEFFRHLPPPPAAVWLGGEQAAAAADDGWTLQALPGVPAGAVEARWFDAADARQRAELFVSLPPPQDDAAAPFAWAHRALLRRALRLRIAATGADAPATLLHLSHWGSGGVEAPLLLLELLPGARCVLLETHERSGAAAGVQNLQVHVNLAERASLQHLRVCRPAPDDRVAHHLHVRLQRDAQYAQSLLASGSGYHLQRNVFELEGEGATAQASGVLLAAGTTLEQQVLARHAAPRTRSAIELLALPSGAAHVVGSAHTRIGAGCSGADARQRLAGIPTAGQPRIVLRPHLEIHHDDVQAAHGATWGALPEEALFHARQRGLDERAAKELILAGLARAVLTRAVDDAALPQPLQLDEALAAAIAGHLGDASTIEETAHG